MYTAIYERQNLHTKEWKAYTEELNLAQTIDLMRYIEKNSNYRLISIMPKA